MNTEKVKLIIRNLEILLDSLKAEFYSDLNYYDKHSTYNEIVSYISDYDEIFEESDLEEEIK